MIVVAVVNFKTAAATTACLQALLAHTTESCRISLLDNGSGETDVEQLRAFVTLHPQRIALAESPVNLGFAGGVNLLLRAALSDADVTEVLLLNSDACVTSGLIDNMRSRLDAPKRIDMIAARLMKPDGTAIESLGIALYRSTLASNRKREEEILLGPTGGCALLTRRLLEDMLAVYGEWLDERFFCYAEDTDFAIRARWLGYQAAYAGDAVAHHSGSLSSGGPENDFVLYHGIRNSLWWLVKDAPAGWLLRSLPCFLALHAGICLRHLRRGRGRILWRLYRDAIRGIPPMLRKRRVVATARRVPKQHFAHWVEPHFYERGYLRKALRDLWRGERHSES